MQFDDIAVCHDMFRAHLLTIEYLPAPYTCITQTPRKILMHESRNVEHVILRGKLVDRDSLRSH
jgi:hypothetical protein